MSTSGSKLADILFPTEEQEELTNSILSIPPEQRRLQTETYDFTVSTLLDSTKQGNIYIPKFQRSYVWSDSQASRLIESLIIQCPIPVIYLSQDKDDRLAVIDGNQRLTSLKRYVNNEFSLSGLTAYPDLEGLKFFQLDPRFQRHIMNRTLRCLTILKETHSQVKFDVFERLNTGSIKLSFQELRHAMAFGPFMELTENLAKNKFFKDSIKTQSKRMKHEELVIRYLAMKYELESYKKPLNDFLNSFCEKNKTPTQAILDSYKVEFESTVDFVKNAFGTVAFQIIENGKVISKFNAALFDAVMIGASEVKSRTLIGTDNHEKFMEFLAANAVFKKAISQSTSDENQVTVRIYESIKFFRSITQ